MFITLEGIEGSGKTTQINHLVALLEQTGHRVIVTREPGGTIIGQSIRAILLDPKNRHLAPEAELLLYLADRAQHLHEVIRPALMSGKTVVCDRYYDATLVYQGHARGLDMQNIKKYHTMAGIDLKPDLTFLLDLPVAIGLHRAWKEINNGTRSNLETRFEKEKISFHEKVKSGYLTLAAQEPDRFCIIDAARDPDQVKNQMAAAVMFFLEKADSIAKI